MLHLIIYADITGPIVDFCVNVIDDTGLAGVFLLMTAGSRPASRFRARR